MSMFSAAHYEPNQYAAPQRDDVSAVLDSVIESLRIEDGADSNDSWPMWNPEGQMWVYLDVSGHVQGPFPATVMQQWYECNYFPPDLTLRRTEEPEFYVLAILLQKTGDTAKPFLVDPARYARGADSMPKRSLSNSNTEPYSPVPQSVPGAGAGLIGGLTVEQLLARGAKMEDVAAMMRVMGHLNPAETTFNSPSMRSAAATPTRSYSMSDHGLAAYKYPTESYPQWTGSPVPQVAGSNMWGYPMVQSASASAAASPKPAWLDRPQPHWGQSIQSEGLAALNESEQSLLAKRAILQSVAPQGMDARAVEPQVNGARVDTTSEPVPATEVPGTQHHDQKPEVETQPQPKEERPTESIESHAAAKHASSEARENTPKMKNQMLAVQSPVSTTKSRRESAVVELPNEPPKKTPPTAPWAAASAPPRSASLRKILESEERVRSAHLEREKAEAAEKAKIEALRLQQLAAGGTTQTGARAWGTPAAAPKPSLAEIQREESRNVQMRAPAPWSTAAVAAAAPAASAQPAARESPWKPVNRGSAPIPIAQQLARPTQKTPAPKPAMTRALPVATAPEAPGMNEEGDGWVTKRPKQAPRRDALSQMNDHIPRPEAANAAPAERKPQIMSVHTGVSARPALQTNGASSEFIEYCREQLRDLRANVDSFLEMLLSFPVNPTPDVVDIIAESVNATSSKIDGRRFALDFVSRRKLDAGIRPTNSNALSEGDFQVVKPKGSRRRA